MWHEIAQRLIFAWSGLLALGFTLISLIVSLVVAALGDMQEEQDYECIDASLSSVQHPHDQGS